MTAAEALRQPHGWCLPLTEGCVAFQIGAENPWPHNAEAYPVFLANAERVLREGEKQEPLGPLACYDAGLLSDWGGGNVEWWQDYIRAELGRAYDFYASQWDDRVAAAPAPALQAVVEVPEGWIDFNDRHPKEDQLVLICGVIPPDVQAEVKGWRCLARFKAGDLLDMNGCTCNSATHWMPLADSFADGGAAPQPPAAPSGDVERDKDLLASLILTDPDGSEMRICSELDTSSPDGSMKFEVINMRNGYRHGVVIGICELKPLKTIDCAKG